MNSLWADHARERRQAVEPLAARMRPTTLSEFVGQEKILGPGALLRRMIDSDQLTSAIFWGPPGTGKTALAEVIAQHTGRHFERAHAAVAGVKDIRNLLAASRDRLEANGARTILFLDEIHRFARNQQDVLLADVERGLITLIGATTENPYFSINSALNSRSTIFQFEPLTEAQISAVVTRTISDERGYGSLNLLIDDDAIAHWARICDGDARRALNAMEVAVMSTEACASRSGGTTRREEIHIDIEIAEQSIQAKALNYDGAGDEHYDVASAFIKSMRGSDPDAAVYWLARMLEAGEDPRFIARRIAVLASEDIGCADPSAIQVAVAAWQVVERVGMPECQYALAQAVIHLAVAPKSNASAQAIRLASADVREARTVAVPVHLRDSSYASAKKLGHGENYVYPHNSTDGDVGQEYLGVDRVYYQPTDRGREATVRQRLDARRRGVADSEDHTAPAP